MKSVQSAVRGRPTWIVLIALSVAWGVEMIGGTAGASPPPPQLDMSPHGNVTDGQTISVAVSPNGYFTPHARVNILECADPGGLAANLPKDATTCDGNTVQQATVLVATDGSFIVSDYPVYALPSSSLGEQSNYKPMCNATNYCVLYVGQDQNDFTAPKVLSAPFLVAPGSAPSTTAAGSTSPASGSSSGAYQGPTAPAPSSAASTGAVGYASGASATLADTGLPLTSRWIFGSGMALLAGGIAGRRIVARSRR